MSALPSRHRYLTRRLSYVLAALLTAGALAAVDRAGLFGRPPAPDFETYDGKAFRVTGIVDGDTLDVDAPDRGSPHTRIRLWGVDTPETRKPNTPVQYYGPEATAFAKAAVMDQAVTLQLERGQDPRDKYGRLLAFVILPDGRMLNRELIAQGYGYADPRFDHHLKREFHRLQQQAMSQRAGLWRQITQNDLPYYYREKMKLPR